MNVVPTHTPAPAPRTALAVALSDSFSPVAVEVPSYEKESGAEVALHVASEQVRTLYRQSAPVLLANVANAVVTSVVLWPHQSHSILLTWIVAMAAMTAARIELRRRFWVTARAPSEARAWGKWFTTGSLAAGCLWGFAGGVLMPEPLVLRVFVIFVLGGMAAGAAGSISCYMPAFHAYLLPALLPAELRLIASGDEVQLAMAATLALFAGALSMVARNVNRALTEAFELRFEKSFLLRSVSLVQDSLTQANLRLSRAKEVLERRIEERTHALHQSEQRLAEIVREFPDGIMIVDENQTVVALNPVMERLGGLLESDSIGKAFAQVVSLPTSHLARVSEEFQRVLAGEERAPFEVELTGVNGESYLTELHPRLVARSDGGRSVHAVVRDVTKQRQQEIVRQNLETQLRQSQRLESIGLLAGGVAHDFNNVLTVVMGNLDALATASDGERRRALTDEIRHAAGQAARLTTQLLAFSRQQVLDVRTLDLNHVVEGVDALLRRLLGERSRMQIFLSATPATISSDATQLEQALINLVVNARDAMPDGGNLDIRVARTTLSDPDASDRHIPPGEYVRLTVTDTGTGMDEETRHRIFEPFFTTKLPGHGTGLGLSTVHGIVRQSGGYIDVQSTLGEGTRFEILLPFKLSNSARCPSALPPAPHEHRPATILLAEDQPSVRRAASRILSAAGYEVLVAASGEQALELARAHQGPIDLLVTDVVMPGLSGADLSKRLLQTMPGLSVLLVSGYTRDPLRTKEVGERVHFLQKPFDAESLQRAVYLALEDDDAG